MVTARHTTYNAQREAPNNPPAVAKITGCNRRLSEVLPIASCFSAARRRAISEVMLRAVGTAPLPDATCAADADASWHTRKADWRGTEGIGGAVSERGGCYPREEGGGNSSDGSVRLMVPFEPRLANEMHPTRVNGANPPTSTWRSSIALRGSRSSSSRTQASSHSGGPILADPAPAF